MGVYDEIRAAIIDGRFPSHQVLSESFLANEFGTSRTPVREALYRLEHEQLIERASRGVRVRDSSPEEILDIYEVRITLEGAAARAAAHRATALDLARLRSAQESMRDAGAGASERFNSNRRFHEAIWEASHNPTLIDMLQRLDLHLIRYPTTTLTYRDRWEEALQEHEELLEAIERRDAERAREIAEQHMTGAREARLQMYADAE